jgi:hypothetical protein
VSELAARPWENNEDGPTCSCGGPTTVKITEDGSGEVLLLCLFHTYEAGAMWRLPAERPVNWPDTEE